MKKLNVDPMGLDKETIASLDEKQLREIIGGVGAVAGTGFGASSCSCCTGTTSTCACSPPCTTGTSQGNA